MTKIGKLAKDETKLILNPKVKIFFDSLKKSSDINKQNVIKNDNSNPISNINNGLINVIKINVVSNASSFVISFFRKTIYNIIIPPARKTDGLKPLINI